MLFNRNGKIIFIESFLFKFHIHETKGADLKETHYIKILCQFFDKLILELFLHFFFMCCMCRYYLTTEGFYIIIIIIEISYSATQ